MEAEIVEVARFAPQVCICGSHQGPFVDTGFHMATGPTQRGRVYVCTKCCAAIGTALGYATPDEVAALKDVIADLEEERDILTDSLAESRENRFIRLDDAKAHGLILTAPSTAPPVKPEYVTGGTDAKVGG